MLVFKRYSLVQSGILLSIVGSGVVLFLTQMGVSEVCAQELWTVLGPWLVTAVGGGLSWYGRWRIGDLKVTGVRK